MTTLANARIDRQPVAETTSFHLRAQDAFEQGMGAWGVQRGPAGGIILYDRMLVEDDGPGIGGGQQWSDADPPVTFVVGGNRQILKVLYVDRPHAMVARLYVSPGQTIEFNGRVLDIPADCHYSEIPLSWLREGENRVRLLGPGDGSVAVKSACRRDILINDPSRIDRPARSFTSTDGGTSWQPWDGEFLVRLHLVQFAKQGNFISPAIDLWNDDDDSLPSEAAVVSLRSRIDAYVPSRTRIELLVRSGSTPLYEPAHWSDWRAVDADFPADHRYLQWKAILASDDPTITPVLHGVSIEAQVRRRPRPTWVESVHRVSSHNPDIRYTSIPFAYEEPTHPKLMALRQKYKLDEVVDGAISEFEKFVRIRDWVAHQWKFLVPEAHYPAWDAEVVLSEQIGFCVHYAVVCMQCLMSLGYQARYVYGNNPGAHFAFRSLCTNPDVAAMLSPTDFDIGHEVCEVWSNEHNKWVYLDVSENFHCINPLTGIPLSLLEVHDQMLATYYGGQIATPENAPREDKTSDALAICFETQLRPAWSAQKTIDGKYPVPRLWMLLRYMDRNNFLAQPHPLPIRHGHHWDWSEFWCWQGPQMPMGQWLYRNFTARRADLDWTIDQVRFDATATHEPGVVRVQMCTATPGFQNFLVNIDHQGWRTSDAQFSWQLHAGNNCLEMRVKNAAGVLGPISRIELAYQNDISRDGEPTARV